MRWGVPHTTATTALLIGSMVLASACSPPSDNVYQGYVEGEFVYIATSEAGRLEQLSVKRGQDVANGAPLFSLESTEVSAARQQAHEQLANAEAQLRDIETGKRPAELDITRAQRAQALAEHDKAMTQWQRDEAQFAAGAVSQAQRDVSRANAHSSAARVAEFNSRLIVDQLPGREAQRAALAAQVAAARAALAQADWRLTQTHINATRAGRIIDTLYREGEWIPAGSPVIKMLPPQNVKIRFFVPEGILGKLHTGNAVRIACDGCAHGIEARITYIASDAEYTPPVIYSNDRRDKLVYFIEAHPLDADAFKLHPGQPVQVTLP